MKSTTVIFLTIFAFVAALHLATINAELNGIGGDNAYYILLGKSIATGQGYQDIGPGSVPHVHFQPGFPLLLAAAFLFFGQNIPVFHAVVVLCELAAVVLIFFLLRRLSGTAMAVIVSAIFVLNPFVNISLVRILTEFPYLVITALALLLAEKSLDRRLTAGSELIGLPLLVVAAYFTRSAGISLVVAFVLFRLAQKQWKTFFLNMPVLALPALLWKLRQTASGREADTVSHVFARNSFDPAQGTLPIQDLLFRMVENAQDLAAIFFQFLSPYSLNPHPLLVAVSVALVVSGFVAVWQKRKASLLALYVPVYVGMLLVWPFNDHRKLLPVIPFVLYYFLTGIRFVTECSLAKLLHRHPEANPLQRSVQVMVLAGFLIIVSQIPELLAVRRLQSEPLYYPPATAKHYEGFAIDWSHFGETYFWLRGGVLEEKVRRWTDFLYLSHAAADMTFRDAVIVSRKPSLTAFYSNRPSICYPFSAIHETQRTFLLENKVDYVIVDGMFRETYTYLMPYVKQNGDAFVVVKRSNKASLLRVVREKL